MAMNHIAIANRSSSRAALQKANESQPSTSRSSTSNTDIITDRLSQLSVISFSSNEGGDTTQDMNSSRSNTTRQSSESCQVQKSTTSRRKVPTKPSMAKLERLTSVQDIEACVDEDLSQLNTLNKLENRWRDITGNFENVLEHLTECGTQVTVASTECLQSLVGSIETTCDSVDGEVKALYHLMTRCDELTTKLSAASSFRDEIRTLRKSVETLDNLYKSRPNQKNRGHS